MKVWITRYALSSGITEQCGEARESGGFYSHGSVYYGRGSWAKTECEALKMAESMRVKKLASLRKQIAKLEALRFDV